MFNFSLIKTVLPLLFLLIAFEGCVPMLERGQENDLDAVELRSLEKIDDTLNQMDGIDTALYLTKKDLTVLLNKTFKDFKDHFTSLDLPDFSSVSFESISLDLSRQKISSTIAFSFEVDALKGKVFGHLSADHNLQAGTDVFYCNTNFNEIVLDRIEGVGSLRENSRNKELIGAAVKSFMHILNDEITNMPLVIPVDMNILSHINGKDIASSPDYKLHSARSVNIQTKMGAYLPYVSEKGVAFLGASKILRIDKTANRTALRSLRDDVHERIKLSLSKDMGISWDTLQEHSSYYVSKKYLSKQMNLALKRMDLRVINKFFLKIAENEKSLDKELYLTDKRDLPACEGLKKECSTLLNVCEQQCERKFGVHRCDQCENIANPFEHVRCMSKMEACKRKEELNIYECHKRENRCDAENNLILASCEKENLEDIKICQKKKESLQFVDDAIAIARLHLSFNIDNSYAVQRIRQMSFDEGLHALEVTRDIHISADSRIGLKLSNKQKNEINCSLGLDEDLLVHSENDKLQETKVIPLSTQRGEDGAIWLKAVSQRNLVSSYLKNTAFETLMKTKAFNLQCTYQGIPMPAVAGEKLLTQKEIPYGLSALLGHVELYYDEMFSFEVSPVRISTEIVLYPTMEADAIGFSRQAHFY